MIRSNRGRGAAWRQIWAWPLHSRVRALITVVVVAAVLLVIGRLAQLGDDQAAGPGPVPAAPTMSGEAPTNTTTSTSGQQPPPPAPPTDPIPAMGLPAPQPALQAAAGFARNWVYHPAGSTDQQWVSRLTPYVMPELAGQLYTVDIRNISANKLVGDPEVVYVSEALVEVNWKTDAETLNIKVIHPHGEWLVSRYGVAEGP